MNKKILFITKIIIIYLFCHSIILAAESNIIPLKKPILDAELKAQKISKNIIIPKLKPQKITKQSQKLTESVLKPQPKIKKKKK